MTVFLGIDLGAGSMKVSVVSESARVIGEAAASVSTVSLHSGWAEQDPQEFRDKVARQIKDIYKTDDNAPTESIPIRCTNTSCGKDGVKPATVLYGRALPEYYFHAQNDLINGNDQVPPCDLLLVAGTSLTVYPSAGLPGFVSSNTRRIVINKDIM